MTTSKLTLTAAELLHARDWIMDCTWGDIDSDEDIEQMTDAEIQRGIARHFSGGIAAFKQSCDNRLT